MNTKIKNLLGIVISIVLLVFAYGALKFLNISSESINPSSFRSFSVSADAKVVALPDIAQFSFSIITQGGKNISDLQKENTTKANKIIDFIKNNGVAAKDIQTTNYNLEPRYQTYSCPHPESNITPCPPADIVGYTITQTVSVKIRDFQKIGDLLAGIVQNGANNVSQLSFTIDDPATFQTQARAQAIAKAQAQAQAVAQAAGFKLGRLIAIEEGYTPIYYPETLKAMGGTAISAAAPAPTIEPGSQEIQVTMTLRYEIK